MIRLTPNIKLITENFRFRLDSDPQRRQYDKTTLSGRIDGIAGFQSIHLHLKGGFGKKVFHKVWSGGVLLFVLRNSEEDAVIEDRLLGVHVSDKGCAPKMRSAKTLGLKDSSTLLHPLARWLDFHEALYDFFCHDCEYEFEADARIYQVCPKCNKTLNK